MRKCMGMDTREGGFGAIYEVRCPFCGTEFFNSLLGVEWQQWRR